MTAYVCEWESEQILNGTSAQLGYTVPFILDVLENTGQKTNSKRQKIHKLIKCNSEKANDSKYCQTKLPWFSRLSFYGTRPGNEVGLFYNAPEPTRGLMFKIKFYQFPFNICHLHRQSLCTTVQVAKKSGGCSQRLKGSEGRERQNRSRPECLDSRQGHWTCIFKGYRYNCEQRGRGYICPLVVWN